MCMRLGATRVDYGMPRYDEAGARGVHRMAVGSVVLAGPAADRSTRFTASRYMCCGSEGATSGELGLVGETLLASVPQVLSTKSS